MKVCDDSVGKERCGADDWLTRAETPRNPIAMYRSLLLFTAWVAMISGLSGAFAWCIATTLNDMTRLDCQAGHVRACQALKQP